jgi:hypothetical protein
MTDVAAWLRQLGLERFEATFRDHEIIVAVLPELTDKDLKDRGAVSTAPGAASVRVRHVASR